MQSLDCSYCRRTFYKLEHLKRHERSHTGARPFTCSVCNRAFSRQDSLFRHKRLHTRADSQPYASPSPSNGTQLSNTDDNLDPELENSSIAPSIDTVINTPHVTKAQSLPARDPSPLPGNADQVDYDLIWPDSENLFQTIVSNGVNDQWQTPESTLSVATSLPSPPTSARFGDQAPSIDAIPLNANNQVLSGVTDMIQLQSSSVTAAAKTNAISSLFLDECLHMFFVRFLPTFPIIHRPTFVFKDCLQPLLLNAMAIGSLYLGQSNAVAQVCADHVGYVIHRNSNSVQGEALWRLSHNVLATMWQHMISHQGRFDEKPGVQLLITSLLGQIYGILSRNPTIRMTSQAFHVLTFVWAKQCGISGDDSTTTMPAPPMEGSDEEKDKYWRQWIARSIQQRALLANYALDGLISRMMGTPTSERPSSIHLDLHPDDGAFAAQSLEGFLLALQMSQAREADPSFQSTLNQLLTSTNHNTNVPNYHLSGFTLMVLQESLQSILTHQDDDCAGFHSSSKASPVDHALLEIHSFLQNDTSFNSADKLEATLRWHAVCLESLVSTSKLCRLICHAYNIQQTLWVGTDGLKTRIDIAQWPHSSDGRRALLHAVAIQSIVEDLPRGRAHAVHMPSALFAAATICAAFCLTGITTVNLPSVVSWEDVVAPPSTTDPNEAPGLYNETCKFIKGEFDSSTVAFGAFRNLPYEFNSVQKLFGCLATQWGVSAEMSAIVRRYATLFR